MGKKEEQSRKLFSGFAKFYDWHPFTPWLRWLQKKTIERIRGKDIKILDIGCGTGYALQKLHERFPKAELHGIDFSPEMLAIAKKRMGKNARLRMGVVQSLPYNANSFDYVICTEAFHHFEQQEKSLKEMKRVCRKNGFVIVSEPEFLFPSVNRLMERIEPGNAGMHTPGEMKSLFEDVGLKVACQKRVGILAVLTEGRKI
ncbi:class I SAM-dependent methyltransferase [Candidatus Woesearchaeota archaeon]|nr:class I SAM-dependent methyltransferase [Candidatus Woesearchaeota archaeon]